MIESNQNDLADNLFQARTITVLHASRSFSFAEITKRNARKNFFIYYGNVAPVLPTFCFALDVRNSSDSDAALLISPPIQI